MKVTWKCLDNFQRDKLSERCSWTKMISFLQTVDLHCKSLWARCNSNNSTNTFLKVLYIKILHSNVWKNDKTFVIYFVELCTVYRCTVYTAEMFPREICGFLLQGEFIWSHVAASGTGKLANHTDFNMNKTLKPYLVWEHLCLSHVWQILTAIAVVS